MAMAGASKSSSVVLILLLIAIAVASTAEGGREIPGEKDEQVYTPQHLFGFWPHFPWFPWIHNHKAAGGDMSKMDAGDAIEKHGEVLKVVEDAGINYLP